MTEGMQGAKLQYWDAHPEEQGSFCDLKSQHIYVNVGDFGRQQHVLEACDRGDEVYDLDGSVLQDPATPDLARPDSTSVDQRFNLWLSEQDGQLQDCPRKAFPGR